MEKRKHQRIKVNVEGVFVLSGKSTVFSDFAGFIDDISEGGIKIVINDVTQGGPSESIEVGDTIHFTGTDEYVVNNENKISLVEGDARVVRKEYSEGKVIIGCVLEPLTNALEEYIKNKKSSSFLISLEK